jgi:ATPase subunit of ABC transporter with duplicated ATPase domains
MMLARSNVLILDELTNHLDLESITALNNSLIDFPEVVLFTSHDHEFVNTLVNRVIELTPAGIIDRLMSFEEYVESAEVAKTRELMEKKAA